MQHIGKALRSFVKKNGLEKGIGEQKVIDLWPKTVGKKIASKTTAKSINMGLLVVEVVNPAWRQELQLQKKTIIQELNKILKKNRIKDIRFL